MNPLNIRGWKREVPLCSLKMASRREADQRLGTPEMFMTDSLLAVVNLDKHVAKRVPREENAPQPKANDAYYVSPGSNGETFFIEFKTGRAPESEHEEQIKGSMKLCVMLGIMPDEEAVRTSVHYILVYSAVKNADRRAAELQKKQSLNDTVNFVAEKSTRRTLTLFGIEQFEGVYCRLAESMTEEEFHALFVQPMESVDPCRVPYPTGNPYCVQATVG